MFGWEQSQLLNVIIWLRYKKLNRPGWMFKKLFLHVCLLNRQVNADGLITQMEWYWSSHKGLIFKEKENDGQLLASY